MNRPFPALTAPVLLSILLLCAPAATRAERMAHGAVSNGTSLAATSAVRFKSPVASVTGTVVPNTGSALLVAAVGCIALLRGRRMSLTKIQPSPLP